MIPSILAFVMLRVNPDLSFTQLGKSPVQSSWCQHARQRLMRQGGVGAELCAALQRDGCQGGADEHGKRCWQADRKGTIATSSQQAALAQGCGEPVKCACRDSYPIAWVGTRARPLLRCSSALGCTVWGTDYSCWAALFPEPILAPSAVPWRLRCFR